MDSKRTHVGASRDNADRPTRVEKNHRRQTNHNEKKGHNLYSRDRKQKGNHTGEARSTREQIRAKERVGQMMQGLSRRPGGKDERQAA